MPTTARCQIRALRIVRLLIIQDHVTTSDVAKELEISRRAAHNWLMASCVAFPIYSPNEFTRIGCEAIEYKLIHKADPVLVEKGRRYFERMKSKPIDLKLLNNETKEVT